MEFKELVQEVKKCSLHELYKLFLVINAESTSKNKLEAYKNQFGPGDVVYYYDSKNNKIEKGIVLDCGSLYLHLRSFEEPELHIDVSYALVSHHKNDFNFKEFGIPEAIPKLKDQYQVGMKVFFIHKKEKLVGLITKLNPKTASVKLFTNDEWNIPYEDLVKIQ